jgi:Cu/Ag efflux protein CusF
MKTHALSTWIAVCVAVAGTAGVVSALADQAKVAGTDAKHYTGRVVSVDLKDHTIRVKGLLLSKEFNLGDTCAYTFAGKAGGAAEDLRPGQKVRVEYQDHRGVLVADRVAQEPMRFEGKVKFIDPERSTLTVRHGARSRKFQIAKGCSVKLHDAKTGTLGDVQPGELVTITYETPRGVPTARQIAQTSEEFTGSVVAVDLSDRTVKAKSFLETKRFNLADGCTIMVGGKPAAQMQDLKPGDKITVNYEEVNGVNVADRIAEAGTSSETMTAQSEQ